MKKIIKYTLMLLVALVAAPKINVNAATYTDVINNGGNWIANDYVVKEKNGQKMYQRMNIITRRSDNHFVYCLQPEILIEEKPITGYDYDWANVSGMTQAEWNRISLLAYYGYGYQDANHDHTDVKWYVVAQYMIWQTAPQGRDIYFTDTLNGNRITKYVSEMQEMEDLLALHYKVPSFNNTNLTMNIGETKTINDDNGVLNLFQINTSDGATSSINGNILSVTANQVGNFSIILAKNNNKYGIAPIVYVDPTSQNVLFRGDVDPTYSKINIQVFGGKVNTHKIDSETGNQKPQGEATLEGAIYGIYRDSDNQKIGTVTIGKDGNATSDYLPGLGRYYLIEEKASSGYTLDSTKYYFNVTADNLNPNVNVYEKVISVKYDIAKVYADDKTGIMTAEVGVKFGFYDNKGKLFTEATTDKDGHILVTLPYGSYTVKQLTSTKNYEKAKDFTISVKEESGTVKKTIANAEITARLKVVKIDSETKEVIKRNGIKFKIFNITKNEYVCQTITYPSKKTICEYETDENGEFITPYALSSGKYRLEEVDQKIDGYLWNKLSHEFEIGEDAKLITDSEYGIIFDTDFENQRVKGQIKINKVGEKAELKEEGYVYTKEKLEGVKFCVFAQDDIKINGKVIYKKGTNIKCGNTNKDGVLIFDNLELGKYIVKEISTLEGYILDDTEHKVTLKYKDQYTPVIEFETLIENKIPKGKLVFTKTDFSESKTLPNTTIEIYTEDDKLVFTGKTSDDGTIIIDKLPAGKKYYILEKEAPEGYKLNEEKMWFEITKDGEIVKATMKDEQIIEVPDTEKNENNLVIYCGISLLVIGTGVIVYAKRKSKKD